MNGLHSCAVHFGYIGSILRRLNNAVLFARAAADLSTPRAAWGSRKLDSHFFSGITKKNLQYTVLRNVKTE